MVIRTGESTPIIEEKKEFDTFDALFARKRKTIDDENKIVKCTFCGKEMKEKDAVYAMDEYDSRNVACDICVEIHDVARLGIYDLIFLLF